jgi:hypothetical protein
MDGIISKCVEHSDDVKIARRREVLLVGKFWKNIKLSLQIEIGILEATIITVVKYSSEKWVLRKATKIC